MSEPGELWRAIDAERSALEERERTDSYGDRDEAMRVRDVAADASRRTDVAIEAHDRLAADHAVLVAAATAYLDHTDMGWWDYRGEDGKMLDADAYDGRQAKLATALYDALPKATDNGG